MFLLGIGIAWASQCYLRSYLQIKAYIAKCIAKRR